MEGFYSTIIYSHSIIVKPTEGYWDRVLVLLTATYLLDKKLDFLHAGNLQDIGQDFLHISFICKIACNVAISFACGKYEEICHVLENKTCLKSHHSPAQWKWPMAIATNCSQENLCHNYIIPTDTFFHWSCEPKELGLALISYTC